MGALVSADRLALPSAARARARSVPVRSDLRSDDAADLPGHRRQGADPQGLRDPVRDDRRTRGRSACSTSSLQYLRTYALSHTTNRMDVELGQRLFAHLLRLPMSYFETRPAGQTVARVRELETIRTFLTGQGLFSAIDLVFAFVFIAVMFAYSVKLTLIVLMGLPVYIADRLLGQAAAAGSGEREVQPRRGEPAVPGRDGRRRRHCQGGGGRADHARAVGGKARGLCEDELRRDHARVGRAARHSIRQQADHRRAPLVRRQGGDRRRTDRRGAGRLQHDRRLRRCSRSSGCRRSGRISSRCRSRSSVLATFSTPRRSRRR